MFKLSGVVPPLITPFDREGNLDLENLEKLATEAGKSKIMINTVRSRPALSVMVISPKPVVVSVVTVK